MTRLRPGPSGVRILKSIEIVTLKCAPLFSLRVWGRSTMASTEEYCWAITQAAMGHGGMLWPIRLQYAGAWISTENPYTCIHVWVCIYMHIYILTAWCRVHLEQLTGLQLVKKFPAFHGTPKFITALTSIRHLSISWVSPIQSIYPHPTAWRSILLLYTHLCLGLPSGLFPSGFPTKTLYTPSPHPYAPHEYPYTL